MPAEEVTFRVAFEGPLTEFTRRNPRAVVSLWCDWRREVVELHGAPGEEVERLKETLRPHTSFLEHYEVGAGTNVLVLDCIGLPHDYVNEAVDSSHCVSVPPTRFENGWEHYSVVSFNEARTREMFQAMREAGGSVELLSKRRLHVQPLLNTRTVAIPSLLAGLTDKQVESLLLAARHGLYNSPRSTTAAAIADAVGLSRSTFEEHVRKAENRLIHNLVPYLELTVKARKAAAGAAAGAPQAVGSETPWTPKRRPQPQPAPPQGEP